MEELVAVERNHNGDIISFKTSTGRVISYRKALQEIENGIISGVKIIEQNESDLPVITLDQQNSDSLFDNYPPIF